MISKRRLRDKLLQHGIIKDNKENAGKKNTSKVSIPEPLHEPLPKQCLMPIVNEFMNNIIENNKTDMASEKIEPFSEECKYGKNGLILFIGKQGSGKSFKIMQTLLYTEMMDKKPFFNNVLFCSTSNENDKTIDAFKHHIKTKIEYVNTADLTTRLNKHLKHKQKLNAIMEYLNSKGTKINKVLSDLGKKHELTDTRKTARYFDHKLYRYGNPEYPANTLLILDDCLGNQDLERKDNPLVQMMTKLRHYNITCIMSQQSIRGIGKTVRRLASDCSLWSRFGRDDFLDLTSELNLNVEPRELYKVYKKLEGNHSCMHFHNHCDEIEVEVVP
jgi:energy-coupling factor transporter ATP-binding protein EcfA2